MSLSPEEKYNIITSNLQEVLGEDKLKNLLKERTPKVYWGTATTGKPHIAYFLPLLKLRDFIAAGCHIKILLADIHALLDNQKSTLEEVNFRVEYYKKILMEMLKLLDADIDKIEFVKGSEFQLSTEYATDIYKLLTITKASDAQRAGSAVVKQTESPLLSSIIYPLLQALDEEYLDVDAQFGGVDQRKIFIYAEKFLPKIGYKKRIHLMNPMIPGLNSGKMSASDNYSKIDMLDTDIEIYNKIKKSLCEEGASNEGLLQLLKHILLPIIEIKEWTFKVTKDNDSVFLITGNNSYSKLEELLNNKNISSESFINVLTEILKKIITPVREEMIKDKELIDNAYRKDKK